MEASKGERERVDAGQPSLGQPRSESISVLALMPLDWLGHGDASTHKGQGGKVALAVNGEDVDTGDVEELRADRRCRWRGEEDSYVK